MDKRNLYKDSNSDKAKKYDSNKGVCADDLIDKINRFAMSDEYQEFLKVMGKRNDHLR